MSHILAVRLAIVLVVDATSPGAALRNSFGYDAWNRLSAIYEVGPDDVDSNGELTNWQWAWQGLDCLERFEYDALGRRVRTAFKPGTSEAKTTEHVYGTGAAVVEEYEEIGTTGTQSLGRWFIHGESCPPLPFLLGRRRTRCACASDSSSIQPLR
jgi:hypothetical protein